VRFSKFALACLSALVLLPVLAQTETQRQSYVSIIIDDLGYSKEDGRHVTALPGPVACSILPHTPYARDIAELARKNKKEVLLHLPMESTQTDKYPGPGKLDSTMSDLEIAITIDRNLESVPFAAGINNHMGSRLTQVKEQMDAVMATLKAKKTLMFIDSLTSTNSLAAESARDIGLPYLVRDIFLDNVAKESEINSQIDRLIQLSRKRGYALAIGHPYPETMAVLKNRLPRLGRQNVKLISLAAMLELSQQEVP